MFDVANMAIPSRRRASLFPEWLTPRGGPRQKAVVGHAHER